MTDVRAVDPPAAAGVSILIYGAGEAPMAVLAAALAHREAGGFRWADGARSTEMPDPAALQVLEVGSGQPEGMRVPAKELFPPTIQADHQLRWLLRDPPDRDLVARLEAFIHLPSILQGLVARAPEPDGRSAIVLTNLDALPITDLERALATDATHATLHREGVTMFVTFRGTPSDPVRDSFDRIYRVEGRPDQAWQEAVVSLERGEGPDGMASGRSLGERLPWLGLSGSPAEPPPRIRSHRLR
jgi:hypothetical protein